jgi:hypothetical protein
MINKIQEAKNRYPVGTKFKSVYETGAQATVINLNFQYIK